MTFYKPSAVEQKKLENNFTYHAPKMDQADRFVKIREMGKSYAGLLVKFCPPSRELSLALTALEECIM